MSQAQTALHSHVHVFAVDTLASLTLHPSVPRGPDVDQQAVFDLVGKAAVDDVLKGCGCTRMAPGVPPRCCCVCSAINAS